MIGLLEGGGGGESLLLRGKEKLEAWLRGARRGCRPGVGLEARDCHPGPLGGLAVLLLTLRGQGPSSCMVVPVVPKPGRGQQRPGTQQPELDGTSVFAWIRGREAGGSV